MIGEASERGPGCPAFAFCRFSLLFLEKEHIMSTSYGDFDYYNSYCDEINFRIVTNVIKQVVVYANMIPPPSSAVFPLQYLHILLVSHLIPVIIDSFELIIVRSSCFHMANHRQRDTHVIDRKDTSFMLLHSEFPYGLSFLSLVIQITTRCAVGAPLPVAYALYTESQNTKPITSRNT